MPTLAELLERATPESLGALLRSVARVLLTSEHTVHQVADGLVPPEHALAEAALVQIRIESESGGADLDAESRCSFRELTLELLRQFHEIQNENPHV